MELSVEQLALLAGIVTVAVWFLTVIYTGALKLPKPDDNILKAIVFGAALVLSYFWTPLNLPDFNQDWMAFVGALLASAVTVYKFAQIIYDFMWSKFVGVVGRAFS